MNRWGKMSAVLAVAGALAGSASGQETASTVDCVWHSLAARQEDGLLMDRVNLWRQGRMMYMVDAEDDYLLSGFESRPGRHAWQGEHAGKWLHAATLAYEQTQDAELLKELQTAVERLLASQDEDGYMGTYGAEHTFMAMPENVKLKPIVDDVSEPGSKKKSWSMGGWDVWTLRYNLYGLLTYEQFHPDPRVVEACRKMGDLLIEYYGPGKYDLTKYGTRRGISSTTLLESIMMLHERTADSKYLDFAVHIVDMSEKNPRLKLMSAMLQEQSVVLPGDGKVYQMLANLLGYIRLYQATGDERYLETVVNAWEAVMQDHLYTTGGPWSRKMPYNGNKECFAYAKDFSPEEACVETCSTTTWIQMNLHLFELTGEAKYAAEVERATYNALMAAQYGEGLDWCYYTEINQPYQPYEKKITCCASSGPRALEMVARNVVGTVDGAVSFVALVPGSVVLPEKFGHAEFTVTGNYPIDPQAVIRVERADGVKFPVEFRAPAGARLASVVINGSEITPDRNERGFYVIDRVWEKGDEVQIVFEYLLEQHITLPKEGESWVAFSYGPWALARVYRADSELIEPFAEKDVRSKPVTDWLEPSKANDGELPQFRIKGTDIILKPYFSACDRDAGPRTYFRFTDRARKTGGRKPNIVFFLVDDMGWMDSGCYGSSFYETPNIDRLANEGVRFTDAYATCPVCSPSRASILTGKYPARLKLTDWIPGRKEFPFQRYRNAENLEVLPLEETTVAEALKMNGYRTGMFGKWHLGEAGHGPVDQGFDVQVPHDWYKGWPKPGYFYPFAFEGLKGEKGDYLTDLLTDEAVRFIEESGDRPFFLFLSHFAVHDPIQGKADLVAKYKAKRKTLPDEDALFMLEGNPDASPSFTPEQLDQMMQSEDCAGFRVLPNRMVKVKLRQDNPSFAAMIESMDVSLGRVMAKLEELRLDEDTIIIFTSDNGGMSAAHFGRPNRVINPAKLDEAFATSNYPLRGAKGWMYEGGIRVPLIIKWPGVAKPGVVSSEPVTGTDYYPTILDMAGISSLPLQHVDGQSLLPVFGGNEMGRDAIFWHFPHYSNHGMQSPAGAIRSGKYKLIEYFENGSVQLFDVVADPGEKQDLSKSHPEIVKRLRKRLKTWRGDVGAEGLQPNPDFDVAAVANKAASVSFTRLGAQASIPSLPEVQMLQ